MTRLDALLFLANGIRCHLERAARGKISHASVWRCDSDEAKYKTITLLITCVEMTRLNKRGGFFGLSKTGGSDAQRSLWSSPCGASLEFCRSRSVASADFAMLPFWSSLDLLVLFDHAKRAYNTTSASAA